MGAIKPILDISEKLSPDISGVKIGQRIDAIVNYKVVDKTKIYTVLKITGFYIINDRRIY